MDPLILEVGLALVLIAAVALLAGRLGFSVVPFLIVVGMAVGPHLPTFGPLDLGFEKSAGTIEFLGRVGVLFLLFYLGLEFSVGRLIRSGRSIAAGGAVYIVINFTASLHFGWVAGFPFEEVLVIAGIITISSSAIVAKMIVDLCRTANLETEMILGIIMFEDVFLAVYLSVLSVLSVLSGLVLGDGGSPAGTALQMALVVGYVLLFFVLARKATPLLNRLLDIRSGEAFVLAVFAALSFVAGFSKTLHVAEAIGALLLGLVLSETEHRERIERLVIPFRDFFGAIFFFGFGLSIVPRTLRDAALLALSAVALTLVGNFVAGMIAGRNAGLSRKASANVGLTIVSRGEFSIIVASVGAAGGLSGVLLQPFTALYVLVLSVLGPLLTKESERIFDLLSRPFARGKERPGPEEARDARGEPAGLLRARRGVVADDHAGGRPRTGPTPRHQHRAGRQVDDALRHAPHQETPDRTQPPAAHDYQADPQLPDELADRPDRLPPPPEVRPGDLRAEGLGLFELPREYLASFQLVQPGILCRVGARVGVGREVPPDVGDVQLRARTPAEVRRRAQGEGGVLGAVGRQQYLLG